jgi:hypothetical protein
LLVLRRVDDRVGGRALASQRPSALGPVRGEHLFQDGFGGGRAVPLGVRGEEEEVGARRRGQLRGSGDRLRSAVGAIGTDEDLAEHPPPPRDAG